MSQHLHHAKAFSEADGLDKASSLTGTLDSRAALDEIRMQQPVTILHGGPVVGELYTLAYDPIGGVDRMKHLKYVGEDHLTHELVFARRNG